MIFRSITKYINIFLVRKSIRIRINCTGDIHFGVPCVCRFGINGIRNGDSHESHIVCVSRKIEETNSPEDEKRKEFENWKSPQGISNIEPNDFSQIFYEKDRK